MNTALAVLIFIASSVSTGEKTVLYAVFPINQCEQIVADIEQYSQAQRYEVHAECQPYGGKA